MYDFLYITFSKEPTQVPPYAVLLFSSFILKPSWCPPHFNYHYTEVSNTL